MTSDIRQKTQDAIDALRTSLDACNLTMLADCTTGLVLCTDTGSALPHNALEQIAAEARSDIDAPYLTSIARAAPLCVTRISKEGWTVTLRAATGDEMIVCQCASIPDRAVLDRAAQEVFDILSPIDEVQA